MDFTEDDINAAKINNYINEILKTTLSSEIKHYFNAILLLVLHKREIIHAINLSAVKEYGLKHAPNEFLELLVMCNLDTLNGIVDENVAAFFNKRIFEYLDEEYNNYESNKIICIEHENKENIMDLTDNENITFTPDNDTSKVMQSSASETMTTKITSTNSVDQFYVDFIDNPIIICIIDIYKKLFDGQANITLLNILYANGFFELTNLLITEQVCDLYCKIFQDRKFNKKFQNKNILVNSRVNILHDIKQKFFEPQTILKEKQQVDQYQNIDVKNDGYNEIIYSKIADDFFNRNYSIFISELRVTNLADLLYFYFDSKYNDIIKLTDLMSVLCTDDVIYDLQQSIHEENNQVFVNLYVLLLKNSHLHKKKTILRSKLTLKRNTFKKLIKNMSKLAIDQRIALCLLSYYILMNLKNLDNETIDCINLRDYIDSSEISQVVSLIVDLLNYKINETMEVICLLKILYKHIDKMYFYHVSHYFIFRHVIFFHDEEFAKILMSDIIRFHQQSIYNFPKVLFPVEYKKAVKRCDKGEENITIEESREIIDESSEEIR